MKTPKTPTPLKRSGKWLDPMLVEKMRLEYTKGSTVKELAEMFSVNEGTIQSRIVREQWSTRRASLVAASAKTAAQFAESVAKEFASSAGDLIADVIANTRLAITKIGEFLHSKELKPKDMPDLMNALKLSVSLQRQALGLSDDSSNQGPKSVVSVQVVTQLSRSEAKAITTSDIPMSNPIDLPIGKP